MKKKQVAALLVVAVVLTYAGTLGRGAFHYDDFHSLVNNTSIRDLGNLPAFFTQARHFSADADKSMYRPLVLTSFAIDYAIHGSGVKGFQVTNLLLHLACVLLLWHLVLRIQGEAQWAAAALAALLFAVHPVASEPVNYVSSRSESLAAVFLLAALCFTLGREPRQIRSLGSFCASLLSKATGAALPFLLVCWPQSSHAVRLRRILPYLLVLACYVSILTFSGLMPASRPEPVRDLWTQLATQGKAVSFYLHLLTMPVHQSVDPAFHEGAWSQAAVWAALVLAMSMMALVLRGCSGRLRWWLLWPFWVALPASAVPLNVLVNEHRIYLASAGLFVALAILLIRQRRLQRPILLLVVCLLVLTVQRNQVWATELSLWSDAVKLAPVSSRGRVHLGKALRDDGQLEAARAQFEQAIALEGNLLPARANLANILYEQALRSSSNGTGLLEQAIREYESILQVDANHREALTNLGNAYLAIGARNEAIFAYGEAIAAHPNYPDAYDNLAQLRFDSSNYAEAARLWLEVTRLEPGNAAAHLSLGNAYARSDDLSKAAVAYRAACRMDPSDATPCYNLGQVLFALTQQTGGRAYAQEAMTVFSELRHRHGAYRLTDERLGDLKEMLR